MASCNLRAELRAIVADLDRRLSDPERPLVCGNGEQLRTIRATLLVNFSLQGRNLLGVNLNDDDRSTALMTYDVLQFLLRHIESLERALQPVADFDISYSDDPTVVSTFPLSHGAVQAARRALERKVTT